VCPTQFLDLWLPDWNKTFAPLYAASPKWQRIWRNGIGLPRQGYFVRDKLLYKTGFFSDRLCVPCPEGTPRDSAAFARFSSGRPLRQA